MMKHKEEEEKDELVRSFLRDEARRAVNRLIQDVSAKAAQEVDARLRRLAPEEEQASPEGANQLRCGRPEESVDDLADGVRELFEKYYRQGVAALNRGDAATAAFFLGKCLLLPVSDELKMRQMVRHHLRLALSLRGRQKQE